MRTSNSGLRPVIELTTANSAEAMNLATITLPFPSRPSWQWVTSTVLDLADTEPDASSLRVIMTFTGSGELGSNVFFDDVCLEFIEGKALALSLQK